MALKDVDVERICAACWHRSRQETLLSDAVMDGLSELFEKSLAQSLVVSFTVEVN